ncbi:MAG TPA: protoglobin domain-containing protein [candidate division Zixibacteria bacterium]|nr:protoglobin domain-containing protein [candidate division Zixibacteria bacterium]
MTTATIPGYRMGDPALRPELDEGAMANLRTALLMSDEDITALREAAEIVGPRVEELLDVWYGFIGSHPFLLDSFTTPEGPSAEYLARVRGRFGQWVRDTLAGDFGPAWVAYQEEVGRRHAGEKNRTDGVEGAPEVVPFRYVVALVYPVYATIRPFLEAGARDAEHLERMHQAWLKAVLLNVAVWSRAYVREGWH